MNLAVELDLSHPSLTTFLRKTTLEFEVTKPGATTWVDLLADEVLRVRVNGELRNVTEVIKGARIQLANLEGTTKIEVEARCKFMNTGEGLHRFTDPADGETYLYSQFEVSDARRVFACWWSSEFSFLRLAFSSRRRRSSASTIEINFSVSVLMRSWWFCF